MRVQGRVALSEAGHEQDLAAQLGQRRNRVGYKPASSGVELDQASDTIGKPQLLLIGRHLFFLLKSVTLDFQNLPFARVLVEES
jgi:hypothetical protein